MTNRGRIRFSPTVAGRRRASCRSSGVWSGGAGPALLQFHDDTIRIAVQEWLHAPNVAAAMYGHISNWDTSNVRDMSMLFYEAFGFNEPLGNWDTRNVVNMSGMFDGAVSFNQPLGNWDTGNVVNMGLMFYGAHSFNQPLSDLDTSNVENMGSMFSGASAFNQPLGNLCSPNEDFGRPNKKMKCGFSKHFPMTRSPNRVLIPLKRTSKMRISSFVTHSKIFVWEA